MKDTIINFYNLMGSLFIIAGIFGLPIFLMHLHWSFVFMYAFTIPQVVKVMKKAFEKKRADAWFDN